jgi:hypothetical protein
MHRHRSRFCAEHCDGASGVISQFDLGAVAPNGTRLALSNRSGYRSAASILATEMTVIARRPMPPDLEEMNLQRALLVNFRIGGNTLPPTRFRKTSLHPHRRGTR